MPLMTFMKAVFACAVDNQPCVLIIEDTEVLARTEYQVARTELCHQLIASRNENITVVAITGLPWSLGTQLRRRFEYRVFIRIPDEKVRGELFRTQVNLHPSVTEEDIASLAQRTEGYTVSEILNVIQHATSHTEQRRSMAKPEGMVNLESACSPAKPGARGNSDIQPVHLVTMADIMKSLERSQPCVKAEDLEQYNKFIEEFCES